MSYDPASLAVVNATLQQLAPLNAQFPLLLYNRKSCTGQRYPEEGSFGLWNQDLNFDHVGFDTIVSLYVPPHALLEMWSTGDGDGYYSVQGPTIISDTGSLLAFWHHYDNSPCFSTEVHCGKRVGGIHGWRLGVDFSRMRITWNTSWVSLLHNFASNQHPLTFGGINYPVNNDALFDELCPDPTNRFSCNCHSAYQQILDQHAAAADGSYVNILQNGCNPATMYVPSAAQVGVGTSQECTVQIHAQLSTGTFPTIDNGGPQFYICSGRVYVNAYSTDANLDREVFAAQRRPTACQRNQATDQAELEVSPSASSPSFPTYAWYILGALLVVIVFLGLFYGLYQIQRRRRCRRQSTATSLRRSRMQKIGF